MLAKRLKAETLLDDKRATSELMMLLCLLEVIPWSSAFHYQWIKAGEK
jgi:hypothetical protein